jgi:hypothetical protein
MTNTLSNLTAKQLRQAATIREKIDALEKDLADILNLTPEAPVAARKPGRPRKQAVASVQAPKGKRRMSKAGRARIAAAAKARWATFRAAGKVAAPAPAASKPERRVSAAARAKMAAAAKKRWAMAKAAGKKSL